MSERGQGVISSSLLPLGVLGLCLGAFMQVLDTSIANVSIPYIAGDLATSPDNGSWVITMFAVGNAISLPMTGWFVKKFGSVKVMVLSMLFFTCTSLFCGLSISLNMIVGMRFLQGFVAGPLIPLSQSLMMMSFSSEKKSFAIAFWTMIVVVGPVLGPILGGWITYNYSWPWIFFINVPFGVFASWIVWYVYRSKESKICSVKMDWMGIFLLGVSIACLQILLDRGQNLDWWNSKVIWTLMVVSLISFVFFLLWEKKSSDPLIDFHFFRDRNFTIGVILISFSFLAIFGMIVISPLWLQTSMGYTAQQAGLAVSTIGLVPFFSVLLVARLIEKYQAKYLIAFSFICYILSFFYCATFTTEVSMGYVAFSRFLFGVGFSCYLTSLTAITFAHLPDESLPSAQGIFHFCRIFMGGVGASVFVTIWERRAVHHHQYLSLAINPYNPVSREALSTLSSQGIEGKQGYAFLDQMIWNQSYTLSVNDLFYLSGVLFILFLLPVWFFKKNQLISK